MMLIIVSLISYGLRIFPLVFKRFTIANQEGVFFKFLDYTVCSMIGCIIYVTAFQSQNFTQLYHNFDLLDLLKVLTLIGVFLYSCRYKNILYNFLLFFSCFALISWFIVKLIH